jgi:peptidoglycan/xylan/chitin deacetylase (PgdA/CDA1 family)
MYEYGARAGFWRLHRLFTEADLPVTIYGVATALMRAPAQLAAMQEAARSGAEGIVGYEANGGFLTQSVFAPEGKPLAALPTRDAVLPMLSVLLLAPGGCAGFRAVAAVALPHHGERAYSGFPGGAESGLSGGTG